MGKKGKKGLCIGSAGERGVTRTRGYVKMEYKREGETELKKVPRLARRVRKWRTNSPEFRNQNNPGSSLAATSLDRSMMLDRHDTDPPCRQSQYFKGKYFVSI